jgi:2-polyprenyl-3-methyl-5-hydroxy-6-metoxy-1,4-benzoquinol methylase
MKPVDRLLQRWRIAQVRPYVPHGARVLDIGCADGALFEQLGNHIGEGVGIDPGIDQAVNKGYYSLIPGWFPDDLLDPTPFDVITMLAVMEHLPMDYQPRLALDCARFLKPEGYLVITVPSLATDKILDLLKLLHIIDGMSLEEHHGFDPSEVPLVFSASELNLTKKKKFQLGFNNLFVFRKFRGARTN